MYFFFDIFLSFPGPCQPKIPSVQVPCQSDEVQISWNQTDGAVNYLVRTAGNRGYVKTHNLTQSFLHAPLPCGQEFNVTVQGQGSMCDSIPSSPAFFKTGSYSFPLLITFHWVDIFVSTFCVLIISSQAHASPQMWQPKCSASLIRALSAGRKAMVLNPMLPWQLVSMVTPTSVSPIPPPAPGTTCTVGRSTLLWWEQRPSTAAACRATAPSFTQVRKVWGLWEILRIIWRESYDNERIWIILNVTQPFCLHTDPCAPQNMDATVNCGTKVVALNWNSPNGTYSYTVSAEGGDQSVSLHTNTTTALFSELICGQNYSLRVTPQNQHCAGNYNAYASVLTCACCLNITFIISKTFFKVLIKLGFCFQGHAYLQELLHHRLANPTLSM